MFVRFTLLDNLTISMSILFNLPIAPRRDGYIMAPRKWIQEYVRCAECGEAVPKVCLPSHKQGGEGGCDVVTEKKWPTLSSMTKDEREILRRETFSWMYEREWECSVQQNIAKQNDKHKVKED